MTFSKLISACKQQANSLTASLRKFHCNATSRLCTFAMVFSLTLLTTHATQAQTFSVLHYFMSGTDGATPYAGVTIGPGGVLYGTAEAGGTYGQGTVFKLNQVNSTWVFSPLYAFSGLPNDGDTPTGDVVTGPNGALYGTTLGGGDHNAGTVFELQPPPTFCRTAPCYWKETVLYAFTGVPDGVRPLYVNLAFDQARNIYGTTNSGGMQNVGAVFQLTPSAGGYTESIIHNFDFTSGSDGVDPWAGVVTDAAGNVYGTTNAGGTGTGCSPFTCGTVYQLVPSNGGWLENVLVNFNGTDGSNPVAPLIIDASGNLFGVAAGGGNGAGVVFKLAPSGGGFTHSTLYSFTSQCSPWGGVVMDAAGDFFGVCQDGGGGGLGWVFELTNCSRGCALVDLHDFNGSDGGYPQATPALDTHGNLYGTTTYGGTGDCLIGISGCGVVWEIAGVGAPAAGPATAE